MKAQFKVAFLAVTLLFTGCSIMPWHPFGTAASRAEKAEQRVEIAKDKAGDALVEEVHKTNSAINAAAQGRPDGIKVAQEHSQAAVALADQIFGAPKLGDTLKWDDLIARQTALDAKIRKIADEESARRLQQIAKLSADLNVKTADLDAANKRAVKAAEDLQAFKDKVLKVAWVVGGFIALYFLGQILQLLAHFNPAFETAANAVNAVVSPVLHAGFSKARKAISAATS